MWQLGRLSLNSRLLVQSDAFTDVETLSNAHQNCSPDIAIAPVRPTHPEFGALDDVWNKIRTTELHIMPSTRGCFTPEDAITTAQFAAQRLETPWIVLQITGCAKTLFPDAEGTIEGARELVRSGFSVIPVCTDDPVLCQRMADIGCKAIMPLVSSTPHRCGFENTERIRLIRQAVNIPLILAGAIQTASDVVIAMELGADAVVIGSAIAAAGNPSQMAKAMRLAAESGRASYEAHIGSDSKRSPDPRPNDDTMHIMDKGAST